MKKLNYILSGRVTINGDIKPEFDSNGEYLDIVQDILMSLSPKLDGHGLPDVNVNVDDVRIIPSTHIDMLISLSK